MTAEERGVLQAVTPDVVAEARGIVAAARDGALATSGPDGHPTASRVAVASLEDGQAPLLLVSALSAHTRHLRADPRCSLLVGGTVKGDPLASPRLTLRCRAEAIAASDATRTALREIWLAAHPKAKVYVDLADFEFVRLDVAGVTFVGGFGRAYEISREAWSGE